MKLVNWMPGPARSTKLHTTEDSQRTVCNIFIPANYEVWEGPNFTEGWPTCLVCIANLNTFDTAKWIEETAPSLELWHKIEEIRKNESWRFK